MSINLPILQRSMDNTALSAYMACPTEFLFAMVMHRRKRKKTKTAAPLAYGSLWHKILELHYRSGGHLPTVMESIHSWQGNIPNDYRTYQRAMSDYPKYIKRWGLDVDLNETVGFPDNPMIEVRAEIEDELLDHPYAGKLDRFMIETSGPALVEDHKTTSRLDKHYFKQFENSNQMMGYTFMAQRLAPSLGIVGVRINLAHVLTNKTEFHRRTIYFSTSRLAKFASNYNTWIARIRMDYWSWQLQNGVDPDEFGIDPMLVDFLRNSWEPFPSHFGDNGCSRKFGLCTYYGVCSLPPRFQMKALEADFDVEEWNPLEVD